MGRIVRSISRDASVVCSAIDGKDIVEEIRRIHQTSAVMTAAVGRLAMGASLMGFGMKNEGDSVTVKLEGDGPAGMLVAVADSFGNVKADVMVPTVELPEKAPGKLDVAAAVGKNGTLTVIKDMGLKEPYSGQVPIVSGEIAEDITSYLAVSEQVPSVCALGVLLEKDLSIRNAGGFLIQLLPFASDEVITQIEQNIKSMQSVTRLMEEGRTCEDISLMALEGLEPNVLDDFEVGYRCTCSRERTERMLISLGREQLSEIAADGDTEVRCHFCGKSYRFTPEEITGLIEESSGK
ncbi:MAG: Hsp33 family molecular chaperone HslO [Ruminococcus sp.]|nr:Hsp33 family molecular chaperone HslO [Ruminococcus sp.]